MKKKIANAVELVLLIVSIITLSVKNYDYYDNYSYRVYLRLRSVSY